MASFERSAFLLTGARFFRSLFNFAGIVLFTHLLGASGIGEFFLFKAVLTAIVFVSNLSLATAVEKRISEGGSKPEIISTALLILGATVVVLSGVLWLSRSALQSYVGAPVVGPLIVGLVVGQIGLLFVHVIAGDLRIGATAAIRLSREVVWVLGGIGLILVGFESQAIIYSFVLGRAVYAGWAIHRSDFSLGVPSRRVARSLAEYAKYDIVSGTSRRIHNWADVLIIGFFLSSSAVGMYEVAWRVTQLAGLVSRSVSNVLFPDVSDAHSRGEVALIKERSATALKWATILVVPSVFGGILLASPILDVLFGIQSAEAPIVLGILFLGQVVFVHFSPYKRILDGIGQVRLSARAAAAMGIANIVFNLLLVPFAGIQGAAVGTSLSMLVGLSLVLFYTRQYIAIPYPFRALVTFTGASAVMGAGVSIALLFLEEHTVTGLSILLALGVLLYLGCLLAVGSTRDFLVQQYRSTRSTT